MKRPAGLFGRWPALGKQSVRILCHTDISVADEHLLVGGPWVLTWASSTHLQTGSNRAPAMGSPSPDTLSLSNTAHLFYFHPSLFLGCSPGCALTPPWASAMGFHQKDKISPPPSTGEIVFFLECPCVNRLGLLIAINELQPQMLPNPCQIPGHTKNAHFVFQEQNVKK